MVCAACDAVFSEFTQPGKCPVCRGEFKPKSVVVPSIPSIELNVADQGTGSVQQVPAPVGDANPVVKAVEDRMARAFAGLPVPELDGKPAVTYGQMGIAQPKRQPVDHMTANLYWPFIIMMGKIAKYAQDKYGSVEQYADGRLEGEKSPINHIIGHVSDYVQRKPHDKFGDLKSQLAAISYNAMMEFFYLEATGEPTVPGKLYVRVK